MKIQAGRTFMNQVNMVVWTVFRNNIDNILFACNSPSAEVFEVIILVKKYRESDDELMNALPRVAFSKTNTAERLINFNWTLDNETMNNYGVLDMRVTA